MFEGFKTIILGLVMALLPALTQYLGAVDWSFLGPTGGLIAGGIAMIGMRLITKSAVFQKQPPAK
jgi:preprotein translocase subunit SecY